MTQDAISVEIFANLFKAVVDEMAWILLRSSHTTFVKETQDFAVALVTPDGETFAYPYGAGATPIMGVPMHAGTKAVTDWAPGDVLMTNDPYSTGGMVMHLNDIYLFMPILPMARCCASPGPSSIAPMSGDTHPAASTCRTTRCSRRACGCARSSSTAAAN
jgi:N-methylhydantoinase B